MTTTPVAVLTNSSLLWLPEVREALCGADLVHLNTVVRPPAESSAVPVPRDLMECFAAAFGDKAEVIGSGRNLPRGSSSKSTPQEVLALVSRRPCTLEDVTVGLGLAPNEEARCVKELSAAGLLASQCQGRRLYFKVARGHRGGCSSRQGAYLPLNTGFRFSNMAERASMWSSVEWHRD
jgi:hypothetical protein